ncbi:MAG: hypothetical protein R3C10_18760 [Pirellulales bacterium]
MTMNLLHLNTVKCTSCIVLVLFASPCGAANIVHVFTSPTGAALDGFGNAMAADDDLIYIVAQGGDVAYSLSGTGYAFDRDTFELVATYEGVQEGGTIKHVQAYGNEVYMGSWPGNVGDVERAGYGAIYDRLSGALKYVIANPTAEYDERFGSWAAPLRCGQVANRGIQV